MIFGKPFSITADTDTSGSEIRFDPYLRRFHAFFKGNLTDPSECVAGSDLDNLTIARLAVVHRVNHKSTSLASTNSFKVGYTLSRADPLWIAR